MTQNFAAQPPKSQPSWCFLVQGIGLIGSIGILGSGVALAHGAASELTIPELPPQLVEPSVSEAPIVPDVVPLPPASEFSPASQPVWDAVDEPTVVLPGAKAGYDAPTSIILSERSTGCQTVLRNGQAVPASICPPPAPTQLEVAGVAGSGGNRGSSVVAVGGLSVVNPSPNVWNYYRRTIRPAGRLGNGNLRLIFPLAIPAPISSLFGWRTHPITGEQRFHSGTDLAAPMGTPVLAAFAGQVAIADFLGGYGLTVSLEHNKGTQQTLYAHLSEIFVKPGEWVKQGETIGRVGSTGNSTGPHLHFEFRQLTPEGWVAMDAGQQLEYALAQLLKAMQVAQKGQSS
ncbi:M23 family metallopeptidase [Leptothermofonsia sichuanensis E412]|uniref:M23 family metallopeptidase n=1 Tax=Leptothermofonsia sichuanensis TaxID=2917832 RepID=UPI001CA785AB|nr:M23 family metallopeptidase [Leptothermofonsia sichuanensis]QZZ22582.1 M23 family metallopeptidase [Leptothermofonsia sichuanensis E412]